jgi:hypothetical protein
MSRVNWGSPTPPAFGSTPTARRPPYEHAWELRRVHSYREFSEAEADLRAYLAARAWTANTGLHALFSGRKSRGSGFPTRPLHVRYIRVTASIKASNWSGVADSSL